MAVRPPDDHSGVTLVLKPHAVPYAAGMLAYASWFKIPPRTKSHLVENTCCFKSHQPLTMFAARVHTHTLGKQVYMTREAWNRSGTSVDVQYTGGRRGMGEGRESCYFGHLPLLLGMQGSRGVWI